MNPTNQEYFRALNRRGHVEIEATLPWWVQPRNELHTISVDREKLAMLYVREVGTDWEYAYVEWRSGSAYLFGLYFEGKDLTPPSPPVVTLSDFTKAHKRAKNLSR